MNPLYKHTASATDHATSELIDIKEIQRLTKLRSREPIYRRMRDGGSNPFPKPIRLSHRCSRWLLREVLAWIEAEVAKRSDA